MNQYSAACVALVKESEQKLGGGPALDAYQDPGGVWTNGWGHTNGVSATSCRITEWVAEQNLVIDLRSAWNVVAANVKVDLKQGQIDALTDFVFNEGPGKPGVKDGFAWLKSGKPSTLLFCINGGDFAGAAAQFQYWVYQDHVVLPGLVARRAKEKALFIAPQLPTLHGVTQAHR